MFSNSFLTPFIRKHFYVRNFRRATQKSSLEFVSGYKLGKEKTVTGLIFVWRIVISVWPSNSLNPNRMKQVKYVFNVGVWFKNIRKSKLAIFIDQNNVLYNNRNKLILIDVYCDIFVPIKHIYFHLRTRNYSSFM